MTFSSITSPSRRDQASRPPAIFLMGPTASGKTALAMKIIELLPCEIISVDSTLVYRGMDIGSAKPSAEELAKAPHRLIDIRDPSEQYSAADFREDALRHMKEITEAGRIPLLVGGTMLYFKVLLEGIAKLPGADADIRRALVKQAELEGWDSLHQELQRVDPESALRIHKNDKQRVQRALEVYRSTGKSLTELTNEKKNSALNGRWGEASTQTFPYNVTSFAIAPKDRALLHKRIADRFGLMIEQGFLDEVQSLYRRNELTPELPALRAVGYRQAWEYLNGSLDYDAMLERSIIATRQLAKRQMTWLRSWENVHWFDSDREDLTQDLLKVLQTVTISNDTSTKF